MTKKKIILSILATLVIAIFAVVALMPFFFLLISSFKPGSEMIRNGLQFKFDFQNYSLVNYALIKTERDGIYLRWYLNSIIIMVVQVASGLFLASIVGYGLAKYKFKGRDFMFILVLMVMMVPVEILILPLYKEMNSLNLIDTYWGVILPLLVHATGVNDASYVTSIWSYDYSFINGKLECYGLAYDCSSYNRDADSSNWSSVIAYTIW